MGDGEMRVCDKITAVNGEVVIIIVVETASDAV